MEILNEGKPTMSLFCKLAIISFVASSVAAQNNDQFAFTENDRNENGVQTRGQKNWGQVRCGNSETCVSLDIITLLLICLSRIVGFSQKNIQCISIFLFMTDRVPQQISGSATKLLFLSVGY